MVLWHGPARCGQRRATYSVVAGSLFGDNANQALDVPSSADMEQGSVGDCYFISALGALADSSPAAIESMFINNGDGTYTVRFYYDTPQGYTADYVTVNDLLPGYSSTDAVYARPGVDGSWWIPLLEKAYAQWNETGNEERDGQNSYASLSGGWMNTVDEQVLGCAAADFSPSGTPGAEQAVIAAIEGGAAVTAAIFTDGSAQFNALQLVSSHAYQVVSYDANPQSANYGTFQLANPWGFHEPQPLTWSELQKFCPGHCRCRALRHRLPQAPRREVPLRQARLPKPSAPQSSKRLRYGNSHRQRRSWRSLPAITTPSAPTLPGRYGFKPWTCFSRSTAPYRLGCEVKGTIDSDQRWPACLSYLGDPLVEIEAPVIRHRPRIIRRATARPFYCALCNYNYGARLTVSSLKRVSVAMNHAERALSRTRDMTITVPASGGNMFADSAALSVDQRDRTALHDSCNADSGTTDTTTTPAFRRKRRKCRYGFPRPALHEKRARLWRPFSLESLPHALVIAKVQDGRHRIRRNRIRRTSENRYVLSLSNCRKQAIVSENGFMI